VYLHVMGRGMVIFNTLESASGFLDRRGSISDSRPRLIGTSHGIRFELGGRDSYLLIALKSSVSFSVVGWQYLACPRAIGITSSAVYLEVY
jgi:hypothetical protein